MDKGTEGLNVCIRPPPGVTLVAAEDAAPPRPKYQTPVTESSYDGCKLVDI